MKIRQPYWTCQLLGWGAYVFLGMGFATAAAGWRTSIVVGYLLFGAYSIALTDLLRREAKRRRWLEGTPAGAFWRMGLSAIAIGMIQTYLIFSITLLLTGSIGQMGGRSAILYTWAGVTGADCGWMVFYVAATAPRRFREREVRLELTVRDAELRALEAQINPHFLFNSLNSIRALVAENPSLAQDMLTRLANILRYNLRRDPLHTIPLRNELEVVADYLALEGVRFEDRLRTRFAIDPEAQDAPIPPMLLQTLVENAVKHGIAPRPAGGEVVVAASSDAGFTVVDVENTGRLTPPAPGATGLGIANTRERLRILYGDRARLELANRGDDRVAATARIPRSQ